MGATFLPEYMAAEPRSQPSLPPREPPGQAMAVSRGSFRGRALWRPHTLYAVSPKLSLVHPYPRGPPAYGEPLPDQPLAGNVPSGPFGFAAQD